MSQVEVFTIQLCFLLNNGSIIIVRRNSFIFTHKISAVSEFCIVHDGLFVFEQEQQLRNISKPRRTQCDHSSLQKAILDLLTKLQLHLVSSILYSQERVSEQYFILDSLVFVYTVLVFNFPMSFNAFIH